MFKLLNPNMQEIKSPDGFIPLDIFVSSIGKERHTDKVEGMPGEVSYGTSYTSRDVQLTMWFNARDTIDYRLLRDELYAYFDSYDYFYVIETNKPTRALKIVIDDSISDKRITTRVGEITINARTVDSPFWVSLYTTKELNDTGYSAVVEKYGLVDGINSDNTGYKFKFSNENLLLDTDVVYENSNAEIASYPIKRNIPVGQTMTVSINGKLADDRVSFALFNTSAGSMDTHLASVPKSSFDSELGAYVVTFKWVGTVNDRLRIFQQPGSRTSVSKITNVKLEEGTQVTGDTKNVKEFSVWNAGNVTVEPETMYLKITANGTNGKIEIRNKTTGDVFKVTAEFGGDLVIDGMNTKLNGVNVFRDTNKRYIRLVSGLNKFEVIGATNGIEIDFRYYYK